MKSKDTILRKLIREEIKKVVAEMDAPTMNSIIEPLVNAFDNATVEIAELSSMDDRLLKIRLEKMQRKFDDLINEINRLLTEY